MSAWCSLPFPGTNEPSRPRSEQSFLASCYAALPAASLHGLHNLQLESAALTWRIRAEKQRAPHSLMDAGSWSHRCNSLLRLSGPALWT